MEKKALIVVDMQKDFYRGGSLAVPKSEQILEPINSVITWFKQHHELVVATQDLHPVEHVSFVNSEKWFANNPNLKSYWDNNDHWPTHCVIGTQGQTFVDGLAVNNLDQVFYKGTDLLTDAYSVFSNTNKKGDHLDCHRYLQDHQVNHLYLCGLAMDYCVYHTAMDAIKLGYQVTLILDATAPVHTDQYDAIKQQYLGLGVNFITIGELDALR